MAKAEDLIVISRKEVERQIKICENNKKDAETYAFHLISNGKIKALESVLEQSRPLLPLLEKAWDDCIYEADRTLIEPDRDFTHARIDYEAIEEFKQHFLSSDI